MGRRSSTKASTKSEGSSSRSSAARKKPSLIGNDPLAWMAEEADFSFGDEGGTDRHGDDEIQSEVGESQQIENQQDAEPKNEVSLQEVSGERVHDDEPEDVTDPQASMEKEQEKQNDALTIVLDPELSIAMVRGLYERMQALLDKSGQIVLDASSVEMMDAAALQTLAAFIQEAGARGIDIQWKDVSPKVYEAASLLDLKGHLRL
ncbi:MAG: STAS domain-containing protein [Gammaproteobacteria bacterium]|nr:STAS domain-containing protein [Gammaproteobacteria bacterium]